MLKSSRICLGPDLLDQMAPEDPKAVASRRDIKRINAVMLQDAVIRSAISRCGLVSPRRVLDLGGGDGTLTLKVARRMTPQWRGVELVVLDRVDVVDSHTKREFGKLGWHLKVVAADVFSFLQDAEKHPFDLILSNLFIHHFPSDHLAKLLFLVSSLTTGFVACEPRRSPLTLAGGAMLWAIGCSAVTVRDSVTGAKAGFATREISDLWPDPQSWELSEYEKGVFSHCFVARKRSSP
jgi:SAM-dependent methyltransferase